MCCFPISPKPMKPTPTRSLAPSTRLYDAAVSAVTPPRKPRRLDDLSSSSMDTFFSFRRLNFAVAARLPTEAHCRGARGTMDRVYFTGEGCVFEKRGYDDDDETKWRQ